MITCLHHQENNARLTLHGLGAHHGRDSSAAGRRRDRVGGDADPNQRDFGALPVRYYDTMAAQYQRELEEADTGPHLHCPAAHRHVVEATHETGLHGQFLHRNRTHSQGHCGHRAGTLNF